MSLMEGLTIHGISFTVLKLAPGRPYCGLSVLKEGL